MTAEEFNRVFATAPTYNDARKIIRDEIRRIGGTVTGNESKLELMSKAVNGTPMIDANPTTDTSGGDGIPPKGRGPQDCEGGDGSQCTGGGGSGEQGSGSGSGGSQGQVDGRGDGQGEQGDGGGKSESDIADEIKRAEEQAKQQEAQAKAQREAADRLKKKLEEMRRKAEEERKKKEKEQSGRHYKTNELIDTLKTTGLAYLVGPAGTGKSTLAMDATTILFNVEKGTDQFNKLFAQISFSPDTTSGEMIGRSDVNGNFHESEIVRVFRDGGLILFDEIDDADSAMLIKLNTAIANGYIATPNGMVKRNENCYIVCTANTYGTGPDAMYVGRTRLDAATLDRFTLSTIEVDYDVKLEKCIADPLSEENRAWLMGFVAKVRKVIRDNHMRRLCSTRFVINATKFLAKGKSRKFVEDRFLQGWSDNEVKAVKAA